MFRLPYCLLALCLCNCVAEFPAFVAQPQPDAGRRDAFVRIDARLLDGAVPDMAAPRDEICNGIDDDFDGLLDEQVPIQACPKQAGVCRGARAPCLGQSGYGVCQYLDAMPRYEPDERACDQADNDCDGIVDEGCDCMPGDARDCGTNAGACSAGRQLCANGRYGDCVGAVDPIPETCDGTDEDCNGVVDDVPVLQCETEQPGICSKGRTRCVGGVESCDAVLEPISPDTCNGQDDDCDAAIDEDAATGDCPTGEVGVCAAGRLLCVAGARRCARNQGPSNEIPDGLDNDCDGRTDEREPPEFLDLADLTVGGDGSRPGRDAQNIDLVGALRPGGFQRAPHPFLDGAFSPAAQGRTPIDTDETLFDFSPETGVNVAGQPLAKGPIPFWPAPAQLPDYASPEHSIIELRANTGLTFDLTAIRQAYGRPPVHLALRFGNLGAEPVIGMVLIDGALWRELNVVQNAERAVDLAIDPAAQRLSIVVVTSQGPFVDQRSYVGDATLRFVRPE